MAVVFGRRCANKLVKNLRLQGKFPNETGGNWQKIIFTKNQSTMASMEYETLKLSQPNEHVLNVELNRPKKLNAMNKQFFKDMISCFGSVSENSEIRAVILSGGGRIFTAGLDLMDFASTLMGANEGDLDVARKGWKAKSMIEEMQEAFNVIERCPQPVIAAIHSGCIGGGVDMISACDIRLCSSDAWFQIKEVDIGLAADLGTLQRLPKVIGNHSLLRELCYTTRKLHSDEAKSIGVVSHIYADKEVLMENAVSMATQIAEKSPVAVAGTKAGLNYARDHNVDEGLQQIKTWNMAMLQTEDVVKAAQASMSKTKAKFSKL